MAKGKLKKLVTTILKIAISLFLLYVVSTKISFANVFNSIEYHTVPYILMSTVLFILSQIISAYRLNYLFHTIGYYLSTKSNFILYVVGMFYNFFIPGGIGGDAYKVYVLNKEYKWKVKKLTAAHFIDRFSGLTAIGIVLVLLGAMYAIKNFENAMSIGAISLICVVSVILISYYFTKKVFQSFVKAYFPTLGLSLIVQLLQVASVAMLVYAFGVQDQMIVYIFVFLVSVILSIISFAGIGVREYVFYKAANWLQYNENISVAIGLLFTCITAIVSLVGIVYLFKKIPLKTVSKQEVSN